jgi:RHS repeat-associated protein
VVAGSLVERYIRTTAETPGHWENLSHVVATFDVSNNWKQNFVWSDEVDGITMLEQADVLDFDTDTNTAEITRSFYHRNALGSVMDITDMNQAKVVAYRYDPYGKATITVGGTPQANDPLGQHWAFTGRFLDEESGLLYYRARYYDPGTGRFLQRDPLGYSVGPNCFEYCGSRPAVARDPTGLETEEDKKKKQEEDNKKQEDALKLAKEVERFLSENPPTVPGHDDQADQAKRAEAERRADKRERRRQEREKVWDKIADAVGWAIDHVRIRVSRKSIYIEVSGEF